MCNHNRLVTLNCAFKRSAMCYKYSKEVHIKKNTLLVSTYEMYL